MPTTTSITTTYAGEFKSQYIAAALLSGNTLANGGVTIKPNVKYKEVIKKLSTGALLADGTCDFTPTSSVTTVERILQPKEIQVNLQLCKSDFRSDWEAISMGYSAHDSLPKTFADFLLAHVAEKVARDVEISLWRGAAATGGQFNGFATLLALDALLPAAQEVTGAAITSANVITELGKVVDAIPASLYGSENLRLFVPQNVARAYVRALGGFAAVKNVAGTENVGSIAGAGTDNKGTQWFTNGELSFDGVKLFVANGLANNIIIAAEIDNLYFGTGLFADSTEVKVIDMADIDGSQNVRIVMRMTGGVQYGAVEDIVTYGIVNAAN